MAHWRGALSGRQRNSFVLWRNRPLDQGRVEQRASGLGVETIEEDEDRGRLGGELIHPARGGMPPELQRIERKAVADRDR